MILKVLASKTFAALFSNKVKRYLKLLPKLM
jgi:hypothetical protein